MSKSKMIGWSILVLYGISLFVLFHCHLLTEKMKDLFTIYVFSIPTIAWYLIGRSKHKE